MRILYIGPDIHGHLSSRALRQMVCTDVDITDAMAALNFMYYNFGRVHQTLRLPPAMQAGIAEHV